jgi:hypothetical protein
MGESLGGRTVEWKRVGAMRRNEGIKGEIKIALSLNKPPVYE